MQSDRTLTVTLLSDGGFRNIGVWKSGKTGLIVPKDLPDSKGVYAFAIEDKVRYVGLASRSLKQRLSQYARPGPSQTTNIRLNQMLVELIEAGVTVKILAAFPDDTNWGGFRISASEGLEAALIEDFDLPWNKRGASTSKVKPDASVDTRRSKSLTTGRLAHGALNRRILKHLTDHPGSTELELARAIYGPSAVQPQVNQHCRRLVEDGYIERRFARPFSYVIKRAGARLLREYEKG